MLILQYKVSFTYDRLGRCFRLVYTLCPKTVSPLNILQQPPQTCTDLNEILHTHKTTFISVIDVKFHKNPLFRLRDVQIFQTAGVKINGSYYRDAVETKVAVSHSFSLW